MSQDCSGRAARRGFRRRPLRAPRARRVKGCSRCWRAAPRATRGSPDAPPRRCISKPPPSSTSSPTPLRWAPAQAPSTSGSREGGDLMRRAANGFAWRSSCSPITSSTPRLSPPASPRRPGRRSPPAPWRGLRRFPGRGMAACRRACARSPRMRNDWGHAKRCWPIFRLPAQRRPASAIPSTPTAILARAFSSAPARPSPSISASPRPPTKSRAIGRTPTSLWRRCGRVSGLPEDAPFLIFAVSRSVGWIAHALEQSRTRRIIRPRARYVGPQLEAEL